VGTRRFPHPRHRGDEVPTFVLDGYNITRSLEKFFRGRPDEERTNLVEFIERHKPQGSSRNRVLIVFDGTAGRYQPPAPLGTLEVIFSQGLTADDWIKAFFDRSDRPRDVVVVTGDKTLARWVRGVHAKVLSPREFVERVSSQRSRGPSDEKEPFDDELTEELKRLWLKK